MKARDAAAAAAFSLCVAAVASYPAYDWVQGSSIDALFVLRDIRSKTGESLSQLLRADVPSSDTARSRDLGV